ncbi:hypothetical protein LDENG_00123410, partial [Lucifuga dentata]
QNANAEITCLSCPSPVQLHQEELQLGVRTGPTQEPSTLKDTRVEFRQLGVTDQNPGVNDDHQTNVSAADLPRFFQDVSLDGVSVNEHSPGSIEIDETHPGSSKEGQPEMSEDAALRRAKRSSSESVEFSKSGWTRRGGVNSDASENGGNPGPLLDGHRQGRSEFRWNRDEGRGNNRQEEPKLSSSTFALTGDSAHNHAVVYWSGHNSSVILILTKLYDFHIGSVTESTLWRSTDYGSTYERMNDKVGSKTVLSYLYVCPTNKRKIMVLTDPEFESSVLISSDEGASYQKYRLTFYVLSLLFHPTEEDWALAYSHDQK